MATKHVFHTKDYRLVVYRDVSKIHNMLFNCWFIWVSTGTAAGV